MNNKILLLLFLIISSAHSMERFKKFFIELFEEEDSQEVTFENLVQEIEEEKSNKVQYITEEINNTIPDLSIPLIERYKILIGHYRSLTPLVEYEQEYILCQNQIQNLKKLKKRLQLMPLIEECEQKDNKRDLLFTYKKLVTLYKTAEEKALYQSNINELENEVTKLDLERQKKLNRMCAIVGLTGEIVSLQQKKPAASEFKYLDTLAGLYEKRAFLYQTDLTHYTIAYEKDLATARALLWESAQCAPTPEIKQNIIKNYFNLITL